jgi:hypothetical protein
MSSFRTSILSKIWAKPSYPKINLGTWVDPFPLLPSRVVLSPRYVATHKHVIGLTGMGKSKVLESMFLQLFQQGVGVSFIDPHGFSANAILKTLIAQGFFEQDGFEKRLLYIEFTEDGPYLPFNILKQPTFRPHTIADHVLEAFHRCWPSLADGNASRFDNLILASVNVLIDNNLPLIGVHLLLTRDDFRNRLLQNTKDPFIVSFFRDRLDEWSKRDAPQMKDSALSRTNLARAGGLLLTLADGSFARRRLGSGSAASAVLTSQAAGSATNNYAVQCTRDGDPPSSSRASIGAHSPGQRK